MDFQQVDIQSKLVEILEISKKPESKPSVLIKTVKKDKVGAVTTDMVFDSLDTEGHDEIDIYQIRQYFEMSSSDKKPIFLFEKDIRQILNELSLSKPYCVQRNEFPILVKYLQDNENLLRGMSQPTSLFSAYAALYKQPSCIEDVDEKEQIQLDIKPDNLKCNEKDLYHSLFKNQLFAKPKYSKYSLHWKSVLPDNYFNSENFNASTKTPEMFSLLRKKENNESRPKLLFELFAPLFRFKDQALTLAGVHEDVELNYVEKSGFIIGLKNVIVGEENPPETLRFVLSVYDTNLQEKLTEDFNIENGDENAVFCVSAKEMKNSPIVVFVKVLRKGGDDVSTARELYMRGFEDKKSKKKYAERKVWPYWQHLMSGIGSLKDVFENDNGEVSVTFYKPESEGESVYELNTSKENRKVAEMHASFFYKKCNKDVQLVSGQYQYVCEKPSRRERMLDNMRIIKHNEDVIFDYINRLYIYPIDIVYGKEKKRKSYMCVTISVMNDNDFVKCVYQEDGKTLDDKITTQLLFGKTTTFFDEIKIEIPFPLLQSHYLLFDVVELHDGNIKKQFYTVFPLFQNNAIQVQAGIVSLPLYTTIANALSKTEPTKLIMTYSMVLLSSVYPSTTDSHIAINKLIAGSADESFRSVPLIDSIHFLPLILTSFLDSNIVMNRVVLEVLMKTICGHHDSSEKRNKNVEKYISHFCNFKSKDTSLKLIKSLYLMYKYDDKNPQIDVFKQSWLPFELLRKSIKQIGADQNFWTNAVSFSSLFASTIRSHVLNKEIIGMEEGNAHFSYFVRSVMELGYRSESIKMMEEYLDKLSNPYDSVKNGKKYTSNSPEMEAILMIKTQFLGVFEGSLKLYEASNPGHVDVSDITMLDDLLWIRHLPIAFLMREHMMLLRQSEEINRISLYLMVALVARLDLDQELQNEKENCAAMFLPFVVQFLEKFDNFADWKFVRENGKDGRSGQRFNSISLNKTGEKSVLTSDALLLKCKETVQEGTPQQNITDMEMLGLIYTWVLKNIESKVLIEWIGNEVPSRLEILVKVLTRFILLFRNFPVQESLDVYEEIDRNLKLIVNGLKEHGYYMNTTIRVDLTAMLGGEKKFEIPKNRSLRPMRLDDERQSKLHQGLTREIVKVCLDVFIVIFSSLKKQEAYEQLEQLKSVIASKLFEEMVVDDDIFLFVKNLLEDYRKMIFCGNEDFSAKLFSSLIKIFQSKNGEVRERGVEMMCLFTKNNFIQCGNITRSISLMTTAVVEAIDIKKDLFEGSVEALDMIHQMDMKNVNKSVSEMKKSLLVPDIEKLSARQLILRAETLGDIEALTVVVNDMIEIRMKNLRYIQSFKHSIVNRYTRIVDDIVSKSFVVSEKTISEIENIAVQYSSLGIFKEVTKSVEMVKMKWKEVNEFERRLIDVSTKNKEMESQTSRVCNEMKILCQQGIGWVIGNVSSIMSFVTTKNDDLILHENELYKATGEATKFISQYEKYIKIVDTNPIYPVTLQEFIEIIKGCVSVLETYIELKKKKIQMEKAVANEEKRMNEENSHTISNVFEQFSQVLKSQDESNGSSVTRQIRDIQIPSEITSNEKNIGTKSEIFNIISQVISSSIAVFQKIDKIEEKTTSNTQRLEGAEGWYDHERTYISSVLLLKEKLKFLDIMNRVPMHDGGIVSSVMNDLVQWIVSTGNNFAKEYEQANEMRTALKKILFDERFNKQRNSMKRRTARKSMHLEDKNMRRMTVSFEADGKEKAFGCVEGENEIISKILDEMGKDVKSAEGMMKDVEEKWRNGVEKEKSKIEIRHRAEKLWRRFVEEKKGKWSELKELFIRDVDESIIYTNDVILENDIEESKTPELIEDKNDSGDILEKSGDTNKTEKLEAEKEEKNEQQKIEIIPPAIGSAKSSIAPSIGIAGPSLPNTPMKLDTYSGSEHRRRGIEKCNSVCLIRPEENMAKHVSRQSRSMKNNTVDIVPIQMKKVSDYVVSGVFLKDAFMDVCLYKMSQYKTVMKKLKREVKQILTKHNELNELQQKTRDPDAYSDRLYLFAQGYLETPRLYIKWVEKIAQEHGVRQHYLEAALCETHMIFFISRFVSGGDVFEKLKEIVPNSVVRKSRKENKEEIDGFNYNTMSGYIESAFKYFMMKKSCDFAEFLLETTVEYLVRNNDVSRLQDIHSKLQMVYSMKSKKERGDMHFYLVGFYGSVFGKNAEKEFVYHTYETRESFKQEIKAIVPLDRKKEIEELDEKSNATGLSPEKIFIKVIEVTPLYDEEHLFTTSRFKQEIKIGEGGFDKISKRRIVFVTTQPLPSVLRRQLVAEKEVDLYMNPIETCLDDLDEMNENLQKACEPPVNETLTKALNAVLIKENKTISIVELFFKTKFNDIHPEQVNDLWQLINDIVNNLAKALLMHSRTFPNLGINAQFDVAFNHLKRILFDVQDEVEKVTRGIQFYDDDFL
ncbi:hypothetical protein EIN_095760 [Entamoeba invadens IP1]|uniref:Dedicator of cytokinesis protein n=1 Tax=Entamoeba invadens IP1 TaxID=370355 RepID=A0A0A1U0B3_ENTIV|nr:hypothetical protein EIN_095760 [Entamoeba invadens IP1]ELP87319.1 hypothetical protein EIN_095760 [Entamoeba invadens IP1]|eukprot:XP_004254090.1 hypothetical protein EIN_095760 [Entamoeba invadens IP1]